MDAYWIYEYIKVLGGYTFFMFIWPIVVFWNYIKKRSKIYCFCFCVTVQIVIANTVVLMMGLFNILNTTVVACLFYIIFFVAIWKREKDVLIRLFTTTDKAGKLQYFSKIKIVIREKIQTWKESICSRKGEYILLAILITFAMIYFSYSVFQINSYGESDTTGHHEWVNALIEGKIFYGGVYPEAMHCFIYCLHVLFGIKIYSIMLFLQCIHVMVFLLSAYSMLREIFYWRYSPFFVLGLFLTMNFIFEYSMSSLQSTRPMEFALHTQFVCAFAIVRYLKSDTNRIHEKGKLVYFDENLLLLSMSLAASIATHYYTTMMAFILCGSFVLFKLKKIIVSKYLIPMCIYVLGGCIIAIIPMAGALVSGIQPSGSIYWGLGIIDNRVNNNQEAISEETENIRKPLDPTSEDLDVIEKVPDIGQKIMRNIIKTEYFMKEVYKKGYQGMYGEKRGRRIFQATIVLIVFCIISRRLGGYIKKISSEYPPLILISFLSVVVFMAYVAPELELIVFIPNHRFCTAGHMITLAMLIIPADVIFSMAKIFCKDVILQTLSVILTLSIYILVNLLGIYHGPLYYRVSRYNSAVKVTNSIIDEYTQNSYTIVSPHEEAPQVALYGRHEDILDFIEKCGNKEYLLPTEYVFIYIEKRPIEYYQVYYPTGPFWLASPVEGVNTEIKAFEISKEAAQEEIVDADKNRNFFYNEGRTILESKVYEWCQYFSKQHLSELKVYYEDENFMCYCFKQDIDEPYNLGQGR